MSYHNNRPVFFRANLTDGALIGSFMETLNDYKTIETPIVSQYGSTDANTFVYYKHSEGYVAFVLSFETGDIVASYESRSGTSNVKSISQIFDNGFVLFGIASGAVEMTIFKLYYFDTDKRAKVLDGSTTFASNTSFQYNVISYPSYSNISGSIALTNGNDLTKDSNNYSEQGNITYNIVYLQGYSQVLYSLENSTENIEFTYFCTLSSSTVISTSIYDLSSESQVSTWITPTGDFEHLTVNSPVISNDTEEFLFGVNYLVNSRNSILSQFKLIVYK